MNREYSHSCALTNSPNSAKCTIKTISLQNTADNSQRDIKCPTMMPILICVCVSGQKIFHHVSLRRREIDNMDEALRHAITFRQSSSKNSVCRWKEREVFCVCLARWIEQANEFDISLSPEGYEIKTKQLSLVHSLSWRWSSSAHLHDFVRLY